MNHHLSIQIKALLLLLVFGLNTIVGFACAMGVNMGFNTNHHDELAAGIHVHKDGKKHHHKKKSHSHSQKQENKKDHCCNDSVTKVSQADKSVPRAITCIHPVFFTAFTASYYNIAILYPSQVSGTTRYFTRSYHPPIPDIRIAIQSFQL